jgi:hypothetical protein
VGVGVGVPGVSTSSGRFADSSEPKVRIGSLVVVARTAKETTCRPAAFSALT